MSHKLLINDMKFEPTPCPTCGQNLKVEPRGADWIARCPGGPSSTSEHTGCHAEFGETPEEAINRVLEIML